MKNQILKKVALTFIKWGKYDIPVENVLNELIECSGAYFSELCTMYQLTEGEIDFIVTLKK